MSLCSSSSSLRSCDFDIDFRFINPACVSIQCIKIRHFLLYNLYACCQRHCCFRCQSLHGTAGLYVKLILSRQNVCQANYNRCSRYSNLPAECHRIITGLLILPITVNKTQQVIAVFTSCRQRIRFNFDDVFMTGLQ